MGRNSDICPGFLGVVGSCCVPVEALLTPVLDVSLRINIIPASHNAAALKTVHNSIANMKREKEVSCLWDAQHCKLTNGDNDDSFWLSSLRPVFRLGRTDPTRRIWIATLHSNVHKVVGTIVAENVTFFAFRFLPVACELESVPEVY
eukprot:scaffold15108_cov180-Amphora_coffeaeformis.AAC.38